MSETQQSSVCDFQPTQRRSRDWLNHYHSFAWKGHKVLHVSSLYLSTRSLMWHFILRGWGQCRNYFFCRRRRRCSFCLSKGALTAAAAAVGAWWLWKQPEASADCACSWRDVDEAKWNLGCWTDIEAALWFVLWHNSEFYQDGSVNFRKRKKKK